jgi:hypothetical protein
VTDKKLNATFSSISSAQPSETYYTFDANALVSSATSTTSEPTSTPSQIVSPSSVISGGTLAGIVVGAIAGLALISAGVFFLWRRSKNKEASGNKLDSNWNPHAAHPAGYAVVPPEPSATEKYAKYGGHEHDVGVQGPPVYDAAPAEMEAQQEPAEMEGTVPQSTRT